MVAAPVPAGVGVRNAEWTIAPIWRANLDAFYASVEQLLQPHLRKVAIDVIGNR